MPRTIGPSRHIGSRLSREAALLGKKASSDDNDTNMRTSPSTT